MTSDIRTQKAIDFLELVRGDYGGLARHHGLRYVHRLLDDEELGLAKSVVDTVSEATRSSMRAQYNVARLWAKIDYLQRKAGADKGVWEASRANALKHLRRAIDLGFSDYPELFTTTGVDSR